MKKELTICLVFLLSALGLSAQLRLNVAGNAAIQGNLSLGNPDESNITGIDLLQGFNDLRFSANGTNVDMLLTPLGYLGIGLTDPDYKLHVLGENQTALGLTNTSVGGRAWALYSLGATNGEGAGNFMIRDETAGANRFFINTVGNIGIGMINPDVAKLYVIADANSPYGIRANNPNTSGEQIGILGITNSSGSGTRIGVQGRCSNDDAAGQEFGVYGWVNSTNTNNVTVGVFGSNTGTGNGTHFAGYFSGDVTVTGVFDNPSDEKLKKNIRSLDSAMDRIMSLNPVSYEFRTPDFPQMQLAEGVQLGFIAQEVETVFPELVKDSEHPEMPRELAEDGTVVEYYQGLDYKSLNYTGLIPVLTRGAQEQQAQIKDLEARLNDRDRYIATLEERLVQLEQVVEKLVGESPGNLQSVPLSSAELRQNQPNPFTETTLIKYTVPNDVDRAELRITDINGRILKTIVIDHRGEGTTQLQAQSLSAGTYFYSLVLDGRVQDSKKMVLTK